MGASRIRPFRRGLCELIVGGALVVAVSGCSSGGGHGPVVVEGGSVPNSGPAVNALAVTTGQTWGQGRALWARHTADGSLAVVTTTGVYVDAPDPEPPVAIDQFGSAVQVGPVTASTDGTTLAVGTVSPPGVRVYDRSSSTPATVYDLPPGVLVRALQIDAATGALFADTTVGPFLARDAGSAPQPLLNGQAVGLSAMLPGATVVTPLTGTTDLVVTGGDGSHQQTLPLAAGATVLDAKASPNGSTIAISVGIGEDEFNRKDQIMVLDAASLTPLASIDVGRALDPSQWSITDAAIVITDGAAVSFWTLDGTPATGGGAAVQSAVTNLYPVGSDVLAEHVDGALVWWPAASWTGGVLDPGGTALHDIGIDAAGHTAMAVDFYGLLTDWNLADATRGAVDDRFATGETTDVAISPDGTGVGVSSTTGRVALLDSALASKWSFEATPDHLLVGAVSFDPTDQELATGLAQRVTQTAFDDTVTMWDPQAQGSRFAVGGEREEIEGCSAFYSRIRFSHDGSRMAITSHDYSVLVLDTSTGAVISQMPGTTTLLDIAFSPDDDLLVATYDDGMVDVWSTADYSLAASYRGAPGGYFAVEMLPDSATMAVTEVTGAISLIDVMTGAPVRTFADATFKTAALALSADGSLLAAATANAGIGIWATSTGARLATLTGHAAEVTALAFAPDGTWLASSSNDGTARTWMINEVG